VRILIVEDEPKTAAFLEKGLAESGYLPEVAKDGEEGVFMALEKSFDLVVCDVMMPGLDGWGVVRAIREHGLTVPIIFLTARDEVPDRVKGLDLGADDYLIKPFSFSELLARIRSLLRRGAAPLRTDEICVGDLVIDATHHTVTRAGRALDLTAREFALLHFFAQRRGEVLTRTVLAENVWDMNFECESNVIDVAVRRLRRKVDDPFPHKLIRTVRGMGYVFGDEC
jgi:two-component system copper resistance phosphate regulon response regulator CusR